VADISNLSSSRYGGAITAGLFLREFVGKKSWAHLDIAGPAYAEKQILPYYNEGATGFGVRLLYGMLKELV
jgi:leucyl aminopeptidase